MDCFGEYVRRIKNKRDRTNRSGLSLNVITNFNFRPVGGPAANRRSRICLEIINYAEGERVPSYFSHQNSYFYGTTTLYRLRLLLFAFLLFFAFFCLFFAFFAFFCLFLPFLLPFFFDYVRAHVQHTGRFKLVLAARKYEFPRKNRA